VTYSEARGITEIDAYWGELENCVAEMKTHFVTHLTLR
jgi:hypothetical protein